MESYLQKRKEEVLEPVLKDEAPYRLSMWGRNLPRTKVGNKRVAEMMCGFVSELNYEIILKPQKAGRTIYLNYYEGHLTIRAFLILGWFSLST